MNTIRISRSGIRKELILLLSHIADVREEHSDAYIRKVASLEADEDLQRLISDSQIADIASSLAGLMTLDITPGGYTFTYPKPSATLSANAIKRLLKTHIVSRIAVTWSETIGWPYSQAAASTADTALKALTTALTPTLTGSLTPDDSTGLSSVTLTRHLPPF